MHDAEGLTWMCCWVSGEAACALDGHRVPELQRVHNQEWCVSYLSKNVLYYHYLEDCVCIYETKCENTYESIRCSSKRIISSCVAFTLKWCSPQSSSPQKTTNHPSVTGGAIMVCCVTDKHNQEALEHNLADKLRRWSVNWSLFICRGETRRAGDS